MKQTLQHLVSFILLLCLPIILFSQTADEIIAKHIKAHGGLEKWAQVDALQLKGTFTGFSLEKPFSCYKKADGSYYADLYLGEEKILEAFDGKEGWTIDPWQEIYHARKLNKVEQAVFQQKAEFFTPFFNYKDKGHEVVYSGKETIDGIEVYKLELTRNNGKKESWYLDCKTYLEYSCLSEWVDFAWPSPAETYFDDFREVKGLIIPFFIDRTFRQRNRILQIEEVHINPQIDPDLFSMPGKDQMKELAFLEGEWDVNIEVMTGRGSWYPIGSSPSRISYTSENLLEENISYERIFPIIKRSSFTFHDPSKKYRLTIYNDLTTSMELFEGSLSDSILIFNRVDLASGKNEATQQTRIEITKSEGEGFLLEIKKSQDKGESWNPIDRFTYTPRKE